MAKIDIPTYLLSSDSGDSSSTVSLRGGCKLDGKICDKHLCPGYVRPCFSDNSCNSDGQCSKDGGGCRLDGIICKVNANPCPFDSPSCKSDGPCTTDCALNGVICICHSGYSVCECNLVNPCSCVAAVECEEYVPEGVYIGDKKATPYIYDGSRWRPAVAYVYTGSSWVKCN